MTIGVAGIALFITGSSAQLMFSDQLFRAGMLIVLTIVSAVPKLSEDCGR
jgi:hypothetical protein